MFKASYSISTLCHLYNTLCQTIISLLTRIRSQIVVFLVISFIPQEIKLKANQQLYLLTADTQIAKGPTSVVSCLFAIQESRDWVLRTQIIPASIYQYCQSWPISDLNIILVVGSITTYYGREQDDSSFEISYVFKLATTMSEVLGK